MGLLSLDKYNCISNISIQLIDKDKHGNMSLFHGVAGDILLLNELLPRDTNGLIEEKILEKLFTLQNSLELCSSLNFNEGFAGILYTYAYLTNIGIIETDNDFYSSFDEHFERYIQALAKIKNYDLLCGLIGFGIYYIERAKKQLEKKRYVYKIIEYIISMAVEGEDFAYWVYSLESHSRLKKQEEWIYLGTLHGMPSVMSFLLICIKEGYTTEKLVTMLRKGYNTVLMGATGQASSSFAESLFVKEKCFYPDNMDITNLFYCNGDLGIINLFFEGFKVLNDKSFYDIAQNAFLKLSQRFTHKNEFSSYCMCHGWAGLLYFIHKYGFMDKMNVEVYNSISSNIVKRLFAYLQKENIEPGYLTGYNGIILALLSTERKTCLDRILLLS